MHITIIMVLTYIAYCARFVVAPWKYWQINAHYFSAERGVYSKLATDALIPQRWRLNQHIDTESLTPTSYPVFLKPEWGQNAHGIRRIGDNAELTQVRSELQHHHQSYLIQEAATGQREFEIFSIDVDRQDAVHDVFTITEAVNSDERYPINSKYNRFTQYLDITSQFTHLERAQLGAYVSEIGQFGISRMSVRADSTEQLLTGKFQVIEINLFLPMPINLLDQNYNWKQRWKFIKGSMMNLAKATKSIKPVDNPQPIFLKMMRYGRTKQANEGCKTSPKQEINEIAERPIQP